jgi:hypothetical protein
MTPEEITDTLRQFFGPDVQMLSPEAWQVETPKFRLLVLLSEDQSWLRALVPIVPIQEIQPFMEQILEANFDLTQETHYALHHDVLWGVFQHSLSSLTSLDFSTAVARLTSLYEQGLSDFFNQFVEKQIRQIIWAAKRQGQSLETTLQTLDRFYYEGLMGDMQQGVQSSEEALAAWRLQLERLWPEVKLEE